MKKFFFCCVLLFASCAVAQNVPFKKQWKQIDSLEVLGRVESADELVNDLLKEAWRKREYAHLIKGLLYHYKLYQIYHEDSNQYILDDLRKRISQLPPPYKNVLISYRATFLEQYYSNNRWRHRDRTNIDNPDAGDLETWPLTNLQDSIRMAYQRSLKEEQKLINTPADNISPILSPNPLNRKYRPTLYDLLAHRALEYLSDSGNFPSVRPEEDFSFSEEVLYAPSGIFTELEFPGAARNTSAVKVLQIYQKLEALHSRDRNPEAKVFAQLNRLEYVKTYFRGGDNWEKYDEALQQLSERYSRDPVQALILFTRAYSLYEQSAETNEEGKLLHPDFLQQAVALAERITRDYPNSDSAQKAYRLISSIKAEEVDARIPAILPSNTPGRIFISYKSLDTLQLRISRISEEQAWQGFPYSGDSLVQKLAFDNTIYTNKVALPKAEDYNRHSTEILLPRLEKGSYLVYVSNNSQATEKGFSYAVLQVSDIALSKTDLDSYALYRATDRTSGEGLEKVKVEFFNDKNSIIQRRFTDANGEITDRKENSRNRSGRVRASIAGDTLNTTYWTGYYYNRDEDEEMPGAKTMFYLDRAIYRPGQTVYFKGVLLQHEHQKTKAVPNEFVEVYVEDPNGEVLQEFRLKTNKYGSFTGEFKLPRGGITGRFSIHAEEDAESDTPFWNKIWDKGEFYESGISFSVEEYKRPTFAVEFDSIRESFQLQDTIAITGKVETFMGAALGDLKVQYTITRQKLQKRWWYYQYEDPVFLESDSVRTDAAGNFSIRFEARADHEDLKEEDLIYQYHITATVTDVTGETRETSSTVKIGNKNLLVSLQMPENVRSGDSLKVRMEATSLNDIKVPVTGTFRIYRLEGPDRILKDRLWEAPEINLISEEEFRELFPEEPYASAAEPAEWPRGELIYESEFESDGIFEPEIPLTPAWESGKYMAEVTALNGGNSAYAKKTFDLVNPQDQYLPDHQRFNVSFRNSNFRKDGHVELLLQTGYRDLELQVAAYDNQNRIFREFLSIDGTEAVVIPIEQVTSEMIQISITGIKNNSLILDTRIVSLPREEKSLKIITETFRNKIRPGLEETWSFRITNEEDNIPDAEVLASMYDASLDQFTVQAWETDPSFSRPWANFPGFSLSNVGEVKYFTDKFPNTAAYRSLSRTFDRLQLFGFYFGRPDSYQYRNYLSNKRISREQTRLSGNTRGRVTNEAGEPLPGVTVVISGTSTGTTTNFDGEFALDTKVGDILIFSYVGFASTEISVDREKEVYAVMEEDSSALEEVVVMGYVSANSERAGEQSPPPLRELQGKVAGISVVAVNGEGAAGATATVRIRGSSTVSGEKNPLYIVDGKIVTDYELNADDVVNVEVLEGAEATALYGAKAANGVVVITTKNALEDLQNVEARRNLNETAFFYPDLKLDEEGKLQFTFTTPEALTQWKIRLLAHTREWSTGKYEGTVITQKELNIVPNAPRFLREGDSITFKAKISNLSGRTLSGTAILQLFDAFTMEPIDSLLQNRENVETFNLATSSSTAVSWNLKIPRGVRAVTYRLLARAGDVSDGEENLLPVLSNQMLVTESLPFFVRAGETETYEFRNLKESSSSTLEQHKFTLEYSSDPAWYAVQSLPYLMEFEHECSEQTFARLYANSLGAYLINSHPKIKEVFRSWKENGKLLSDLERNEELKSLMLAETPWLRDAQSETAQKQQIAALFDLQRMAAEQQENLNRLAAMQNSSGAFPWFTGGRDNKFITRHIVAGFGHLKRLGVEMDASGIIRKAVAYLDEELLEEEGRAKMNGDDPADFYKGVNNLHYLYARSFFLEEFPMPERVRELSDKILEAQQENRLIRSVYNKGMLSLVLFRFNEPEMANDILTALKESAVKSEDYGMYWKENTPGWHWYQAPVETQALLIEAFTESGTETETVEELKIWLLQNKRTNHWPTTKATTEATYALLMQGNDWLQTEANTLLEVGGKPITGEKLAEAHKEAGAGYVKLNWKGSEIDGSFSEITIHNNNTTAGYGGAYWQYFEELDKIKEHTESPLNIEKELYLNVTGSSGTSLKQISAQTPLKTGDLVTVRLVVRTTAPMDYIHLKDMRASGFEPTSVLSQYKYQDGTAYYESTRDAATHFFFDSLDKGTYVLEYTVRANNAGNFSNGISTIQSMYAPEFSGHTKGIRVEIKE